MLGILDTWGFYVYGAVFVLFEGEVMVIKATQIHWGKGERKKL